MNFIDGIGDRGIAGYDKLHVDIYVTNAADDIENLGIFLYSRGSNDWYGVDQMVESGKWNTLDIDLSDYKATTLTPITAFLVAPKVNTPSEGKGFGAFNSETEVYVANVYFYSSIEDKEAPQNFTVVADENTTKSSVTLKFNANDNVSKTITYEISYTEDGTTKTETTTGNAGEETTYVVKDLKQNTEYTFSIVAKDTRGNATDAISVTAKTQGIVLPTAHAVQRLTTIDATYYDNDITKIRGVMNDNTNAYPSYNDPNLSYNVQEVSLGDGDNVLMFTGKNDENLGENVFGIACNGFRAYEGGIKTGADYTITIAVFPVNTNKIYYSKDVWGMSRDFVELSVTPNEWNYIIYQPLKENTTDNEFTGLAFKADGASAVFLDNFQMQKEFVPDDGEDPVITHVSEPSVSVGHVALAITGTDNSGKVTYNVTIKDKDGNIVRESLPVSDNSGVTVTVLTYGLDMNTEYTAVVTASDATRTVTYKEEIPFKTLMLPHAEKQLPTASKYYYENDKENLRNDANRFLLSNAEAVNVDEIFIGVNANDNNVEDKVIRYQGKDGAFMGENKFGMWINTTDENFFKEHKDEAVVRMAVYPVNTDKIEYAARFYGNDGNDVFHTFTVKPNEWNYILLKPSLDYTGDASFIGMVFKCENSSTVYLDNFGIYTSADTDKPEITKFEIVEQHAQSAKIVFAAKDMNKEAKGCENIHYEIWVKDDINSEGRSIANVDGKNDIENPVDVTYYINGIKSATGKVSVYIVARDDARNYSSSEKELNLVRVDKTISKTDAETYKVEDTDNGGKVILKGKWDAKGFNEIAAEYPYGCFDVRDIDPDSYPVDEHGERLRVNRGSGENDIKLFNPNYYIITDIGNHFDGNYVNVDDNGKFRGANFAWFDGDFTVDDAPNFAVVNHKKIVEDYEATNGKGTYPGLSKYGYVKLDPYTGNDIYFTVQGASITRQMFMNHKLDDETSTGSGAADCYATIICPYPLQVDNLEDIEFYKLDTPELNGDNLTLNFSAITGKAEANKPYLLKVKNPGQGVTAYFVDDNPAKKLVFSDITYKENSALIPSTHTTAGGITATLYGTYKTELYTDDYEEKIYGLKQGNGESLKLTHSSKGNEVPAFRAVIGITNNNAKKVIIRFNGGVTGITEIDNNAIQGVISNVYSIDGKKVGNTRNGLVNLPSGIYIVNGKKVVIK